MWQGNFKSCVLHNFRRTCIKLIIKCSTSGFVFISEFIFSLAFLQSSRFWDVFFVVCSCRLYWFVRALAYIRSMVRLFVSVTCVMLRLVSVPSVELFHVVYRSVISCRPRFLCRLQPKTTSNLYVDVRRRGTRFKQLFPEGSTSLPGGNQVDGLPPASVWIDVGQTSFDLTSAIRHLDLTSALRHLDLTSATRHLDLSSATRHFDLTSVIPSGAEGSSRNRFRLTALETVMFLVNRDFWLNRRGTKTEETVSIWCVRAWVRVCILGRTRADLLCTCLLYTSPSPRD